MVKGNQLHIYKAPVSCLIVFSIASAIHVQLSQCTHVHTNIVQYVLLGNSQHLETNLKPLGYSIHNLHSKEYPYMNVYKYMHYAECCANWSE